MNTLVVTDHVDTVVPDIDATVGLMAAAQAEGAEVWVCRPPTTARSSGQLLDLAVAGGVRVVNSPAGVRALHEKLLVLTLPDRCPSTCADRPGRTSGSARLWRRRSSRKQTTGSQRPCLRCSAPTSAARSCANCWTHR